ncbi:Hypothetical protein A7982_09752 [Minicystis rosea]|nr:Hypothetical protein A7982_09752 [Minicystis rosea]
MASSRRGLRRRSKRHRSTALRDAHRTTMVRELYALERKSAAG